MRRSRSEPRASMVIPRPVPDERGEIGVGQPLAQDHLGVQEVGIAALAGEERDHHVGVAFLRADEGRRVGLAPVELGQDLVGRVAAPRAVALHLPLAAQILRRRQVDAHVVALAHCRRVVSEQTLDHREDVRLDVVGRSEGPVGVTVDGLEDRLALAQEVQVLAGDVDVVAIGVERGDAVLGTLLSVKAVVVVGADVGDSVLAQDANEPSRDRRLPRRGIADDAEDRGPGHYSTVAASARGPAPPSASAALAVTTW
jgi:hypothetical protein